MADIDPTELVTVKDEFGGVREVPRGALPYFPGYVVLKADGSVNPSPATPSKKD